jgi:hypothetical protein
MTGHGCGQIILLDFFSSKRFGLVKDFFSSFFYSNFDLAAEKVGLSTQDAQN